MYVLLKVFWLFRMFLLFYLRFFGSFTKYYQKPYGFLSFCNSNVHFCCTVCKKHKLHCYSTAKMHILIANSNKTIWFLMSFPSKASFLLYCTMKMNLLCGKTYETLWFCWFSDPQPSFLLRCIKKT